MAPSGSAREGACLLGDLSLSCTPHRFREHGLAIVEVAAVTVRLAQVVKLAQA